MRRFIELVRGALSRTTTAIKARHERQQEPIFEKCECEPRLLQLPVELLLIIAEFLPLEDAAALSLTSKRFFHALSPPRLRSLATSPREELLLRLECDLGASHFYCSYCSKLHCFLSLPRCHEIRMPEGDRCTGMDFQPSGILYWLTYYHGRLVMNRHFYGAPSGLPLESLSAVVVGHFANSNWRRGIPWWAAEFKGAIIQDKLVMHVKHVLESTSLDALWADVEEQYHFICLHLKTYDWAMYQSCQRGTAHGSDHQSTDAILYGSGSCSECPTDYTVEVTKTEAHGKTSHKITVYGYHLMGSFRSHHDRNWRGMINQSLPGESLAIFNGTFVPRYRDQVQVPTGFVRKQWFSHTSP